MNAGVQIQQVHQVDVYECPAIEQTYTSKKVSMLSSKEVWVFHGTPSVQEIMSQGSKSGVEIQELVLQMEQLMGRVSTRQQAQLHPWLTQARKVAAMQ